ncbi:hypothetical protein A3A34_00430 [Candidatus Kaiserbacteria bacterium RIFCSPLOWO2_01_FULL_50_24]|uniref:Uncharacterized protein n=1 Tax=Candidatus Kaiserbacteria bacterium RIFCSPLOWO2_01_FULL_50_24 TaxID=1798507 RepID=A0A1F6EMI0_9BACT|nr:MAG: hypothetical protein A3A34_00430 [Candidatus Kaiserbacteria bacterium RIFCSPLOWO2_01_FULL_50_24]
MEENEVARHIGVAGGVVGLGVGVIRKFLAGGAVRNPGERVPGGGNTGIFDGGGEIAGAGGEAGGVELQPAVAGVPLGVAVGAGVKLGLGVVGEGGGENIRSIQQNIYPT